MYGVRGLGATGPLYLCPDGTTQVFNTADCPGGSPTQSSVQDQLSAISDYLYAMGPSSSPSPAQGQSFSSWANQNSGVLLVGGGLLLFFLMLSTRR